MVTSRTVEYPADGVTMAGYLAVPDGADLRPGVLLGHEGPGTNDLQRRRADRLAELGYVTLAMDQIGGAEWIADPEEMMARVGPVLGDADRMRALGHAALEVLLAEERVDAARLAGVGYGTGGNIVLELARDGVDFEAVYACNPSLETVRPEDSARITGSVLVCVGSEDPIVTGEQRRAFEEEMRAAKVEDWRLHVLGGAEHAFHHPPVKPDGSVVTEGPHQQTVRQGVSYHHVQAQRTWRDMLGLLDEVFG